MTVRPFLLALLFALAAPHEGGPPTQCYVDCIAAVCRDACAPARFKMDCRPCLEKYDEVCLAQCKPKPAPPPPSEAR